MTDEPDETYPPCRCGREVRKLNGASDTPKCVGCGYTEELCRCSKDGPNGSDDDVVCDACDTVMARVHATRSHGRFYCKGCRP